MGDQKSDAADDGNIVELLKKLIEELQKSKRCYNKIKISRSAQVSAKISNADAAAVTNALDDAESKLTIEATDKVTKFADDWCKKGKCKTGDCQPDIDFTIDVSGRDTAMAAIGGKTADVSYTLAVKATGDISCVCRTT